MSTENLASYLKDHLAGSVAALELLAHLQDIYAGRPEHALLQTLESEVAEDQALLKTLLDRLPATESPLKTAGAWMAEKALRLKMKTGNAELGLLEALEVLVLGIEGKLRLWRSLDGLQTGLDIPTLSSNARRQIDQVEALRLEAAAFAFKNDP